MRGRAFPLVALGFVGLVVLPPACGGASDPEHLLGGGGGPLPTAHDAGIDTGTQGQPEQDSGTAAHDSGSPVVDSSTPVVDTGTTVPESSPVETGPTGTTFACPPSTCTAPAEVCCAAINGTTTPSYKCEGPKQCNANDTPIGCATTADCPNGLCCGVNDNNGHYVQVACADTCAGQDSQGDSLIQFCDPAAADCPVGTACNTSQLLPGFHVCQ